MASGGVNGVRCVRVRVLALAVGAMLTGALVLAPAASAAGGAANCRPYAKEACLLPFPNDLLTKRDRSSETGRRLRLPRDAMPTNTEGERIKVAQYNRNDGFSPGSAIVVRVPGLDNPRAFRNTRPVRLADMSKAFRRRAPIVLIDADTGKRRLIWAELDSNAGAPEDTTLLIHPGRNLAYGHRYIVALRRLEDRDGNTIAAPRWFARLRDGKLPPNAERSQLARYRSIFRSLSRAGIGRGSLYAAWDFTVASRQSLTSRMLEIRDKAFRRLGDRDLGDGKARGRAPRFQVTGVESNPDPGIARYVTGTFRVPCFLIKEGCPPGSRFNYDSRRPDALPVQKPGNVAIASFYCVVPNKALTAPARASLYGHGLLGSGEQVRSGPVEAFAREHNFVICGTDTWGMSSADVPYDVTALRNLNRFPQVVDRLQQGILNTLFLGRLMRRPDGFASSAAFRNGGGRPAIDTSRLYFYGNSQGGISGGITTAVAPDLSRSVLGVPGMNYGGLLLQRSTDFPEFAAFLYGDVPGGGYPDRSIHPLLLSLMQQLWDRGEANGYAARMTSRPLPNTPRHKVLMHVAYGDFQVSQYAAAVEARTIGASFHSPALLAARSRDKHLFFRVPPIKRPRFDGSGIVIWDSGPGKVDPPPFANTEPKQPGENDPHGDPRNTVAARIQMSRFLRPNGRIVDVCDGKPCRTDAFTP